LSPRKCLYFIEFLKYYVVVTTIARYSRRGKIQIKRVSVLDTATLPFSTYLSRLQDTLRSVFRSAHAPEDQISHVLEAAPLSVFIPERFGGRGQHVHECLALLDACAYESLPLSLVAGINGALFLQPVSKYAAEPLQAEVFGRFVNDRALGGLMITEPDFGSDALQMRTSFRNEGDGYRVQGTKHWGGLTGRADYWLLTARGETNDGGLERSISFFVWDRNVGGIEVEEYYQNLGLEMISYGRNRIDTHLPADRRLTSSGSGVRMLLDLLHRSRLQFPGMAVGFIRRLLDEARDHSRSRVVGGKRLADYDQVQDRLAELQAAYTVCSAMCVYSSDVAGVDNDCSVHAFPANSIKTVVTDMMQSAAQSVLQLVGAKGYRRDHIAGSALVDSRPFQIFEGSNDILYEQISEFVVKSMTRVKESNLYRFLTSFDLTSRAATRVRELLDFSLEPGAPQRKMVDLGRILSRVVSMQMVIDLGERGFRRDLIDNCLAMMRRQISSLVGTFSDPHRITVIEDYDRESSWLGSWSAVSRS
jgi:alkylation response protein AidB-like acyl-CoA dehydrogenase